MRKAGLAVILFVCLLCLATDKAEAYLSHFGGHIEIVVASPTKEDCLEDESFPWKDCCWKDEDSLYEACDAWFRGWPWSPEEFEKENSCRH